jgi:hypothetical protein
MRELELFRVSRSGNLLTLHSLASFFIATAGTWTFLDGRGHFTINSFCTLILLPDLFLFIPTISYEAVLVKPKPIQLPKLDFSYESWLNR